MQFQTFSWFFANAEAPVRTEVVGRTWGAWAFPLSLSHQNCCFFWLPSLREQIEPSRLGNLCQCLITITGKDSLLISNPNLLSASLKPSPLFCHSKPSKCLHTPCCPLRLQQDKLQKLEWDSPEMAAVGWGNGHSIFLITFIIIILLSALHTPSLVRTSWAPWAAVEHPKPPELGTWGFFGKSHCKHASWIFLKMHFLSTRQKDKVLHLLHLQWLCDYDVL